MEPVSPIILALNSGSSSLKFGLYRVEASGLHVLHAGEVDVKSIDDTRSALVAIADLLAKSGKPPPTAIGHRLVHGGPKLRRHCLIDDAVLGQLEAATAFAPLHIPTALSVIRFAREHFRGLPQAACFDTAFHATMPEVARTLRSPAHFVRRASNATASTDYPANRSYGSWATICRSVWSLRIWATARASPL